MPPNLPSCPRSPWQGRNHPYMQRAVSPAPSHCHGKTGTYGAWGHHMGCLYNRPPRLFSPLPTPPPPNLFLGHPSCLPRVLFPYKLQRSTQGFVTVSNSLPFLLRIILYSSFQTIQYSLGYSYYYQVAGIVKVGVVRSLAFIPYFFCITIHVYKLLIMLLAFINSKRRRSTASAFANGNEALFLNKRRNTILRPGLRVLILNDFCCPPPMLQR